MSDTLGWRTVIAYALGPFDPAGPRRYIDLRLVRRWASGARPIPEWVWPALRALLAMRIEAFCAAGNQVEAVMIRNVLTDRTT